MAPEKATPSEINRVREKWLRDGGRSFSTIYRVPPEIRSHSEEDYKRFYRPKAVCIGPYFFRSSQCQGLKSMQDHKLECVTKLASRTENFSDKCLMRMTELEGRVRSSYSEDISWLESEELAWMLMLDGCFILDLLLNERGYGSDPDEHDKKVVGRLWIWNVVKCDLLLLENQIPFFVIQNLYEMLETRDYGCFNLLKRALRYFSSLDPFRKGRSLESFCAPPADDVHHLLHLIYQSILPCPHLTRFPEPKAPISPQWIPCAKELQAAGVQFKRRENASSFLDITFSNEVMAIPHLKVHDYSSSLFRNLIAFEQCYPPSDFYVTAYAAFMARLVDAQDDLKLLHLDGILTFKTTDDKRIFRFFSRLCHEVYYPADKNYLDGVFRDVTAHNDSSWAKLRYAYFSSPWSKVVVGPAALTFLFAAIQAISAAVSAVRSPK